MPITELLLTAIERLGFSDGDGLVRGDAATSPGARDFVWRELRQKSEADAAYFRGAIPLATFAAVQDEASARDLQRRLWNLGRSPLLIATWGESVATFSCHAVPQAGQRSLDPLIVVTSLENLENDLADFRRVHVEAGSPWSKHPKHFRPSDRVDARLLRNLRELRSSISLIGPSRTAFDSLLGRSIFLRYFEDRGIVTPDHLSELGIETSLTAALYAGATATNEMFNRLAQRFNGDLFHVPNDESALVSDDELVLVADFFNATDLASGQQALWPYDFSRIPAELISSIYEQLLEDTQRRDAAYYTPRHVVDVMLDEAVPWDTVTSPVRILDPACGSGIFLTEAYRRLAYGMAIELGRNPTFDELAGLLTTTVFGVDTNITALRVAALGLYLALLESLDPPTAWRDAHLPPLIDGSLIHSDFFDVAESLEGQFDRVVGNPPWRRGITDASSRYLKSRGESVPDSQIALAFLPAAMRAAALRGKVALLMPSKQILHNRSGTAVAYRQNIFSTFEVETVIDLSPLRRTLFSRASAPAAILVANNCAPSEMADDAVVVQVAPRPSPLQSRIDGLVISQGDVHRIPYSQARDDASIWKIMLWGGAQDEALLARLRLRHETLGTITKERNWIASRGFEIPGDKNDARHLAGRPFAPTTSVRRFTIDTAE